MTTEAPQNALEAVLDPAEQSLKDAFADEAKFAAMFATVSEAVKFTPDLTTASGRNKIASVAHRIAKLKTRVDNFRKKATEEHRAEVNRINGIGNRYKEQLQALQDATRAPLDAWEATEKDRVARVDGFFQTVHSWHLGRASMEKEALERAIATLDGRPLDPALFLERHPEAQTLAGAVLTDLRKALSDLIDREKREEEERERQRIQQEELERLQREQREREEADRLKAEQKALADRRISDLSDIGNGNISGMTRAFAVLYHELEMMPFTNLGDHEATVRMAHDLAKQKLDLLKAEHDRAEATRREAEQKRADEEFEERAKRAIVEAQIKERDDREAEEQRLADERAEREADQAHRAKIIAEATADLVDDHEGISLSLAEKIAHKIAAGGVRHTTMEF